MMKQISAIAAAAVIAAVAALWFVSTPALVKVEVSPLKPSNDLPTFKRVQ
ncbi:hypothetical protein [Bradyrhizobium sp. ORS 375]|nr:hypothetical protein [Bradyrhizobium sp. ORS 375]